MALRNNEGNESWRRLGGQERLAFINTALILWGRNTSPKLVFELKRSKRCSCLSHQKFCEEDRCETGLQDASLIWTFALSSSASLFTGHLRFPQTYLHRTKYSSSHGGKELAFIQLRAEIPEKALIGPVWVTCPSLDQSLQSVGGTLCQRKLWLAQCGSHVHL